MVFPFSRTHQQKTAQQLRESLNRNRLAILHVVRFPDLAINHVVVAFDFVQTPAATTFLLYDPNNSSEPLEMVFDPLSDAFVFPATSYFSGGRVDVYPIYEAWWN